MAYIETVTYINAPITTCFDLSRDVDLHTKSAAQTNEMAIAGRTSGLMELGETVTWKAKHFGLWLEHTSKITEYEFPNSFTDEMVKGNFKYLRHEHLFHHNGGVTTMTDKFEFSSPCGIIGKVVDKLFLAAYLKRFLEKRNKVIKEAAETGSV